MTATQVNAEYEDEHIVVLNKPPGLAVHPGAGRDDGTLVDWLLARYPEMGDLEPMDRPGIVHRLDADTSGLMVVGKTRKAVDALSSAIKARKVNRRYVALVRDIPHPRAAIIDLPIARDPNHRTRQTVFAGGRAARTRYAVASVFEIDTRYLSLLRIRLETGRTHQIRVHMEAMQHPIIGDPIYGVEIPGIALKRQFLHAHTLSFDHPIDGNELVLESELPTDLTATLDRLTPAS